MGKHRDLMDTWFHRVWCENDTAFIHEACDVEMTTKGHREKGLLGPDDFEEFHGMICNLADDISMKILRSVEDENWISVIYEFKAKKKGTDIPVEMTGSSMLRIHNGKIAEVYEHVDFIKLFSDIGAMPKNALEHCLCGNMIHA